jgi:threonine dehydrogenase-like Zn-dependent dehydrogenase
LANESITKGINLNHQKIKETLKKFKAHFPESLQRLGVQTWRAIEFPLAAVIERRSLINAHRIFWPAAEVADFDRSRILGPTANDALVKVSFTLMSPGTERAQLLGLPGTYEHIPDIPYFPGYSGSGKVIAMGKKVTEFRVGDRVAGRIQHGSRAVVHKGFLFRIPDGVSLEEAAFIEMGIIVLQGVRKAQIKPGESVLVLGQGLIGQLANRLSRLAGGAPVVAVARSKAKKKVTLGTGGADRFLTVDDLKREGEAFDVVIEATGDPNIFPFAASLARTGGRVIGLGTPRGRGRILLGRDDCRSGITIKGAHITGMPEQDRSNGLWTYRNEGQLFLDLLSQRRLILGDLLTRRVDPSQAGEIYESLGAGDSGLLGVIFDWSAYGNKG